MGSNLGFAVYQSVSAWNSYLTLRACSLIPEVNKITMKDNCKNQMKIFIQVNHDADT